jgi:hypothetical protein
VLFSGLSFFLAGIVSIHAPVQQGLTYIKQFLLPLYLCYFDRLAESASSPMRLYLQMTIVREFVDVETAK